MDKFYKIGIVGLGSIGKRHLANMQNVLLQRDTAFSIDIIHSRQSNDSVATGISSIYYDYNNPPSDYDIIFITNPTALHFSTVQLFVPKTKHMFIEKPVFSSADVATDELSLRSDCHYYVACPLRYTSVIRYIEQNIDLQSVRCARAICSSYLPDWRLHMDYRKTYSAYPEQGGGVSLDLIHEWDYIRYLFGMPEKVCNLKGKYSSLDIKSDDLSVYLAQYPDKLVEIHLDYFGRKTTRTMTLYTDDDTILADFVNEEINYQTTSKNISFKESNNDFYINEMQHFFDIIEGKVSNDNDICYAVETLKLTQGDY